jgi:hypothetical protein
VEEDVMNKDWHHDHRLTANATREERIAWHAAHEVACHCRPAPRDLADDIAKYQRGTQ